MIRHASLLDADEVVEFVREFYPLTPYPLVAEFDDETINTLVKRVIKTGIMLLATHEGKIVGIIGTHILPFTFNWNVLGCVEAIWYVTPDHQRSGVGIELVKRVDVLRKLRGCKFFQMTRVAGSPEKLDQVLMSLGFQPSEFGLTKVD
jgi:hypothetical protein